MKILLRLACLLLATFAICSAANVARILPADAAKLVAAGMAVREPAEWTAGVAKQAALLPLSDLHGSRTQ